jgi:aminoglycoside phosphotransferase (APT) family kinase protein
MVGGNTNQKKKTISKIQKWLVRTPTITKSKKKDYQYFW